VKSETQGPMANEDLKAPEVAEVLGRELAGWQARWEVGEGGFILNW
jgi:hypothetical protein